MVHTSHLLCEIILSRFSEKADQHPMLAKIVGNRIQLFPTSMPIRCRCTFSVRTISSPSSRPTQVLRRRPQAQPTRQWETVQHARHRSMMRLVARAARVVDLTDADAPSVSREQGGTPCLSVRTRSLHRVASNAGAQPPRGQEGQLFRELESMMCHGSIALIAGQVLLPGSIYIMGPAEHNEYNMRWL